METRDIKCDQCGHDLTYTGNSVDYRVVLGSESKGHEGDCGAVTDLAIPDPFPQTRHFCNETCMAVWVRHEYPNAMPLYERQQKHRARVAEARQSRK